MNIYSVASEVVHINREEKIKEVYSIFLRDSIEEATIKLRKLGVDVVDENGHYKDFYKVLEELGVLFNKCREQNIPDLKRKIKHSKNPMEKKMLEKQLNGLYKERKKR